MVKPTLVTGNKRKIEEATAAFTQFDIAFDIVQLTIDEIQHHDPEKITEAKVYEAYRQLQKPVIVNDSHWSIPALGGFPGGYMKDVIEWFSPDDFLALMRDKDDRNIILTDTIVYYDGETYKHIAHEWHGSFDEVAVNLPNGSSLDRVIREDGASMTLAEKFARRDAGEPDEKIYPAWLECAAWLKEKYINIHE